MQAVLAGDIEPPGHVRLRDGDRPFWLAVVRARARAEWNEADLVHAGNMARCMADVERISSELEHEDDIVTNARGTPIPNPKYAILQQLSARAMALSRLMQMQSRAEAPAEKRQAARAQERKAREVAGTLEDEDLIPTG